VQTITLVTGNKHKLTEWQRMIPAAIELKSVDVDLDEIQSLDVEAVITDKAKRAYAIVGEPIIVEDVSAGLDELHGLPGSFIKFFNEKLGNDALFQMTKMTTSPTATAVCVTAYYDGTRLLIGHGEVRGSVVAQRSDNGFGFDSCFVPAGETKTYAEMLPSKKDTLSHRAKAIKQLVIKIQELA
jgi:inosine triphosphate pyrophosphatase